MEELPLRDIHLPDPIGDWPPAIGWWLVLALLVLLGVGLSLWLRHQRRETPVKHALRQLTVIETADLDTREKLQALAVLMKRVALSLDSRETVAGMAGRDWLAWLASRTGDLRFEQPLGRLLIEAPFRPQADAAALQELLVLCRDSLTALSGARKRITPDRAQ